MTAPERRDGCTDKVCFGTWAKAAQSAKTVRRVNRAKHLDKAVHVYRCPLCGSFHVGKERSRRH